jgi:hypothetical protein
VTKLSILISTAILTLVAACFGASVKSGKTPSAKPASIASGPAAAGKSVRLDQEAVKSYYNDGDFGPAIAMLEDFQKSQTNFTREESLMVYKYLGVMYTADLSSREKGKSYFYKLLKIDPGAKILDMYVSIVVQDIFKSTLDELMGQGPGQTSADDKKNAALYFPDSRSGKGAAEGKSTGKAELSEGKSHRMIWLIGGLGLAAGIASGYYVYSQASDEPAKDSEIVLPPL